MTFTCYGNMYFFIHFLNFRLLYVVHSEQFIQRYLHLPLNVSLEQLKDKGLARWSNCGNLVVFKSFSACS